jgi:hypothetical protein
MPGQQDAWTFTLATERLVVFDSQTNNTNLRWSLEGPQGTVTSDRNFISSDSVDGVSFFVLPAGDYKLTVGGAGDVAGAYRFQLVDLSAATLIEALCVRRNRPPTPSTSAVPSMPSWPTRPTSRPGCSSTRETREMDACVGK